jgi:hypothetical protein
MAMKLIMKRAFYADNIYAEVTNAISTVTATRIFVNGVLNKVERVIERRTVGRFAVYELFKAILEK